MGEYPIGFHSHHSRHLLISSSYKPIRRNVGGIKGQRDGFESYAV